MGIKTQFSIKDLQHLSGIKAHTIRIWEKRYQLLEPDRTNTNIRYYDLENLLKLLNVTYLYNHGYKISKIANLKKEEVEKLIKESGLKNVAESYLIADFKYAMLHFDPLFFQSTFEKLEKQYSFRDIFFNAFIPLLNDISLLWQTDSIDPAHERFISELIKQKIIVQIEKEISKQPSKPEKLFVLFLPMYETHDIGLLYVHYELLNKGYKSIFLGNNIPTQNLHHLLNQSDNIVFVSYLTVQPDKEMLPKFIEELYENVCKNTSNQVWLFGSQVINEPAINFPQPFKVFKKVSDFYEVI